MPDTGAEQESLPRHAHLAEGEEEEEIMSRLSRAEAARRVARVLAGKPAIGCDGSECNNHSHKDWCWERKHYNHTGYYCCLATGHKGPHAACGMTHNLLIWSRNGRIIKTAP